MFYILNEIFNRCFSRMALMFCLSMTFATTTTFAQSHYDGHDMQEHTSSKKKKRKKKKRKKKKRKNRTNRKKSRAKKSSHTNHVDHHASNSDQYKKKRRRRRSKSHKNSHQMHHGSSGWSYGAMLGYGTLIAEEETPIESESMHSEAEQTTTSSSGGHGGHGGGAASDSAPSIGTSAMAMLGYNFNKNIGSNLSVMGSEDGMMDPQLSIDTNYKVSKKWILNGSVSAAAPVSDMSKDQNTLTKLNFSAGPTFKTGRLSFAVKGNFRKSFYKEDSTSPSTHTSAEESHDSMGNDNGMMNNGMMNNGMSNNGMMDNGMNPEEDDHMGSSESMTGEGMMQGAGVETHSEDSEHSPDSMDMNNMDHSSMNKEDSAIGASIALGYNFTKMLALSSSFIVDQVTNTDSTVSYSTAANILKATYKLGSISLGAGFFVVNQSSESMELPTEPGMSVEISFMSH